MVLTTRVLSSPYCIRPSPGSLTGFDFCFTAFGVTQLRLLLRTETICLRELVLNERRRRDRAAREQTLPFTGLHAGLAGVVGTRATCHKSGSAAPFVAILLCLDSDVSSKAT